MQVIKFFKYKNLALGLFGIIIAFLLSKSPEFHQFLLQIGGFGYFGAFLAGILFVSTFTVATGAVILFILAEKLSLLEIGLIAGFGAVVGDFIIFRLVKNDLILEIEPIYKKLGGNHLTKVLHTKYFSWTLPVIGAIIIASSLPDEIGVSLLGLSRISTFKFLIFSFILNAFGIFLIVSASLIIK